jgi:hypothetical protein
VNWWVLWGTNWNILEHNRKIRAGKLLRNGGASRDRTDDLIVANDALSQLSYSPPAFIPTILSSRTAKRPRLRARASG